MKNQSNILWEKNKHRLSLLPRKKKKFTLPYSYITYFKYELINDIFSENKQIISMFCKILAKKRSYQCKYIIIRKNAKKVRRCTVWPVCFFSLLLLLHVRWWIIFLGKKKSFLHSVSFFTLSQFNRFIRLPLWCSKNKIYKLYIYYEFY